MTVAEIIEKLKEMPQDKELTNAAEIISEENSDFNKGVLIGIGIMALTYFNNHKNSDFYDTLPKAKNRYSNICGDYDKYVRGNVLTENPYVNLLF